MMCWSATCGFARGNRTWSWASARVMPPDEFSGADSPEPQIRLFGVPKWVAPKPEPDVAPAPAMAQRGAQGVVCDVDGLTKSAGVVRASPASALLFWGTGAPRALFTNQPVGLDRVEAYGGTRIHSWMSFRTCCRRCRRRWPSAAKNAAEFRDHYDEIKTKWETVTLPAWNAELAKWKVDKQQAAIDAYNADTAERGSRRPRRLPPPRISPLRRARARRRSPVSRATRSTRARPRARSSTA